MSTPACIRVPDQACDGTCSACPIRRQLDKTPDPANDEGFNTVVCLVVLIATILLVWYLETHQ